MADRVYVLIGYGVTNWILPKKEKATVTQCSASFGWSNVSLPVRRTSKICTV